MVSKASELLPDPDSPVMTTSASRGSASEMSLRLCSRAPETTSCSPAAISRALYDPEQMFACALQAGAHVLVRHRLVGESRGFDGFLLVVELAQAAHSSIAAYTSSTSLSGSASLK